MTLNSTQRAFIDALESLHGAKALEGMAQAFEEDAFQDKVFTSAQVAEVLRGVASDAQREGVTGLLRVSKALHE